MLAHTQHMPKVQASGWMQLLRSQVLEQIRPQLADASVLPANFSLGAGRHGKLCSWTPEQAAAEGVPPDQLPRSVR